MALVSTSRVLSSTDSRAEQVLDLVGGLLFHPGVDLPPGGLGIVLEIDGKQPAGLVELVDRLHVRRQEGMGLLAPQGVGHVHFILVTLVHVRKDFIQFVVEFGGSLHLLLRWLQLVRPPMGLLASSIASSGLPAWRLGWPQSPSAASRSCP